MQHIPLLGRWVTVAAIALVVASCRETAAPTGAEPFEATVLRETQVVTPQVRFADRGVESEYVEAESQIPGFGGLYLDASGDIVAYVVGDQSETRAMIETIFVNDASRSARFTREGPTSPTVRVVAGNYTMSELIQWSEAIRANANESLGILSFDADERLNRVRLGIRDEFATPMINALLDLIGVPREAVVLRETPSAEFATSSSLFRVPEPTSCWTAPRNPGVRVRATRS